LFKGRPLCWKAGHVLHGAVQADKVSKNVVAMSKCDKDLIQSFTFIKRSNEGGSSKLCLNADSFAGKQGMFFMEQFNRADNNATRVKFYRHTGIPASLFFIPSVTNNKQRITREIPRVSTIRRLSTTLQKFYRHIGTGTWMLFESTSDNFKNQSNNSSHNTTKQQLRQTRP